jgi:hypothetical protein
MTVLRILYFMSSVISISCNSNIHNNTNDKFSLQSNSSLVLPLDSLTQFSSLNIQHYEFENVEYLNILYDSRSIISVFNCSDRTLKHKVHLATEGPHGVPRPAGILILSEDSILVKSNPNTLYLVNKYGTVIEKISTEFTNDAVSLNSSIVVNTMSPMFVRNNEIYFCAQLIYPNPIKDQTNIPVSIKLNLDSKEMAYIYYRTKKYQQGQWGMGGMLDRFYHTYNADEDLIIHSYGNDEDIYVYDSLNTKRSYYAGSKEMKPIKPPSKDKVLESGETLRYEAFTGAYEAIKYDPYRKMYYRFAFLPVEDPATQPTVFHGKIAIIILDSKFQKVGEYVLPKGYNHLMSFVGKAGLHIASRSKYSQDEDHLTFDIFVPVEN